MQTTTQTPLAPSVLEFDTPRGPKVTIARKGIESVQERDDGCIICMAGNSHYRVTASYSEVRDWWLARFGPEEPQ